MKKIIFKKVNGVYKIPKFIKFLAGKRKFFLEYDGKLYDKQINVNNEKITQISLLVEALNIKSKKERLSFIYDKACDLLDGDFYGKNICQFKCGKCINDRVNNNLGGGCCCDSKYHKDMCQYLSKNGCTIRCFACKLHICTTLKRKGYKYRVNDIYMLKYLLNIRQKIILYNDFFMTKEEVLKDIKRNSIILWSFTKKRKFIKYNIENKEI